MEISPAAANMSTVLRITDGFETKKVGIFIIHLHMIDYKRPAILLNEIAAYQCQPRGSSGFNFRCQVSRVSTTTNTNTFLTAEGAEVQSVLLKGFKLRS